MSCSNGNGKSNGDGPSAPSTRGNPSGSRSKRQELSFADRIQVIEARRSGKSMRQLAVQFGCGKTQILNILSQKDSYLKEWEEKGAESNPYISGRKRRSRRTGNEEINAKVWDWYKAQKAAGVHVTGPMMQHQARSIGHGLGIHNFAASNGWLDSFRRLHNIGPQSRNVTPEGPSTSAAALRPSSVHVGDGPSSPASGEPDGDGEICDGESSATDLTSSTPSSASGSSEKEFPSTI